MRSVVASSAGPGTRCSRAFTEKSGLWWGDRPQEESEDRNGRHLKGVPASSRLVVGRGQDPASVIAWRGRSRSGFCRGLDRWSVSSTCPFGDWIVGGGPGGIGAAPE
ncbi:hypothetical protein NDU88_010211 [Pleurodeles waltl]|uniref:Uncharacterized protein n=1 Tax=Pleurodeles waltl TaxID=8319 RepID=A0AAV7PV15_PLEWA|nr:hypothetical protein NDU88_010211 [Pleurodeles waltl]